MFLQAVHRRQRRPVAPIIPTHTAQIQGEWRYSQGVPPPDSDAPASRKRFIPTRFSLELTSARLCYTNGLLSRGGCTDRTWTSNSCPTLCSNVVKQGFVNLFNCRGGGPTNFQCGTGNGPGDCSTTFNLPNQNILLRADQEPGASHAVNYSDPSATFVNEASLSSCTGTVASTAASAAVNSTAADCSAGNDDEPSLLAVGLGVGLPLMFLLVVSLGIILWQERRIQRSKKHPAVVDQIDLLRAAQTAPSSDHVGTQLPYVGRRDEMATRSADTVAHPISRP